MNILAIETSCDETSAAIVRDGRHVLANVIASQIDIHQKYGGVVPEVASRQHILYITPVLQEALATAGLNWDSIDAVAVTNGPGLAGALLVGVNVGKSIAFARQKPLVGVNHIESHIYANWLIPPAVEGNQEKKLPPAPEFPLITLIVSGGHSEIVLMKSHGDYHLLGKTQDDAAGEAYDKVARVMGLGYPGGPLIEKAAEGGNPERYPFARAWLKGSYDFSFSGLKTAVLRKVQEYQAPPPKPAPFSGSLQPQMQSTPHSKPAIKEGQEQLPVADVAASFQQAVVDVLATKTVQAAVEYKARQILIAGGVAANKALRKALSEKAAEHNLKVTFPPPIFCTDNAAMVAAAAYFKLKADKKGTTTHTRDWALDIRPGWELVR
ncbi:MAG TPA: tRNA (adenosine(37)-N6)-threonylcarbamoyltransferase complex transferase subunit TsaD [Chloroflexia bacterium]|nr:tRNA (adenosine(37)-N6)-threonylcarbamoyltransferase complex transferase subunit TsaD [Chloroflexia bacterium]